MPVLSFHRPRSFLPRFAGFGSDAVRHDCQPYFSQPPRKPSPPSCPISGSRPDLRATPRCPTVAPLTIKPNGPSAWTARSFCRWFGFRAPRRLPSPPPSVGEQADGTDAEEGEGGGCGGEGGLTQGERIKELTAVDATGRLVGMIVPAAGGQWRPLRNLPTAFKA